MIPKRFLRNSILIDPCQTTEFSITGKWVEVYLFYKATTKHRFFNFIHRKKKCELELDLIVFFRKKDGAVGAIVNTGFVNGIDYKGSPDNAMYLMGATHKFPYMRFCGGAFSYPDKDNLDGDMVYVCNIDEFAEVIFVAIDFKAFSGDATYEPHELEEHMAHINILVDKDTKFLLPHFGKGRIFVLCSITSTEFPNKYILENKSRCLGFEEALESIPGFSAFLTYH